MTTDPWAFEEAPASEGLGAGAITVVEGSSFCISDADGSIRPGGSQGVYVRDVRLLGRWELLVDGQPPQPMTVRYPEPFSAEVITWRPGVRDVRPALLVVRRRYVGHGMREDLEVVNDSARPVTCRVTLLADTDFADVFEVKAGTAAGNGWSRRDVVPGVLTLTRRRGEQSVSVEVRGYDGVDVGAAGLSWTLELPARGTWSTSVEVVGVFDGDRLPLRHPRGLPVEHAGPSQRLRDWRRNSPLMRTADPDLAQVLRRSVEDLGTLRIFDPAHPDRVVVAAGAPWFMAPFGRDSLLTSWMVLPVDTSLAVGTLQTLAEHQGRTVDPSSEEEPGRIVHELRLGPAAHLTLGGRSAYYGSADATPLFVMLLGELATWDVFDDRLRALLPAADRALEWVEHYGDVDGDGFVEYERKTERGLVNQGWKDSGDGVNFADGSLARAPIALAEVQGYVYAAYRARARLAECAGDPMGVRRWSERADRLKRRFDEQFWLPDLGWYAVALDADKRPVDALTSNIGHCLWTGIVDEARAPRVAELLTSPQLFSGWGVRTLATDMGAYDPLSYHNGSVWPHDTALCVSGLMRYGFVEQAQRVAVALLEAAAHFGHRLPELFCGHSRAQVGVPVPYPTSCSPQAWAAAAPLELLRALLRLEPQVHRGRLRCAPAVPERYLPLDLVNLRLGRSQVELEVTATGWRLETLAGPGLELVS
ncbi:MAG: amylo-alpha-1,6-glucosidase [Angustibacter sp.]